MSIRTLERIARIDSKRQLAAFRERVTRCYLGSSNTMTTAEYVEYCRYLAHLAKRLAR